MPKSSFSNFLSPPSSLLILDQGEGGIPSLQLSIRPSLNVPHKCAFPTEAASNQCKFVWFMVANANGPLPSQFLGWFGFNPSIHGRGCIIILLPPDLAFSFSSPPSSNNTILFIFSCCQFHVKNANKKSERISAKKKCQTHPCPIQPKDAHLQFDSPSSAVACPYC
jgi:hypothetical protein